MKSARRSGSSRTINVPRAASAGESESHRSTSDSGMSARLNVVISPQPSLATPPPVILPGGAAVGLVILSPPSVRQLYYSITRCVCMQLFYRIFSKAVTTPVASLSIRSSLPSKSNIPMSIARTSDWSRRNGVKKSRYSANCWRVINKLAA